MRAIAVLLALTILPLLFIFLYAESWTCRCIQIWHFVVMCGGGSCKSEKTIDFEITTALLHAKCRELNIDHSGEKLETCPSAFKAPFENRGKSFFTVASPASVPCVYLLFNFKYGLSKLLRLQSWNIKYYPENPCMPCASNR